MGNIRQLAPGEEAPSGLPDVHGVTHCLRPVDMAKLTDMEHEYRWEAAIPAHYLLLRRPVLADNHFPWVNVLRWLTSILAARLHTICGLVVLYWTCLWNLWQMRSVAKSSECARCQTQAGGGCCRPVPRRCVCTSQSCRLRLAGLALHP
jgi:hypothetical protein